MRRLDSFLRARFAQAGICSGHDPDLSRVGVDGGGSGHCACVAANPASLPSGSPRGYQAVLGGDRAIAPRHFDGRSFRHVGRPRRSASSAAHVVAFVRTCRDCIPLVARAGYHRDVAPPTRTGGGRHHDHRHCIDRRFWLADIVRGLRFWIRTLSVRADVFVGTDVNSAILGAGFYLPTAIDGLLSTLPPELVGRGAGLLTAAVFMGQFLSPLFVLALTRISGSLGHAILICGAVCAVAALISVGISLNKKVRS